MEDILTWKVGQAPFDNSSESLFSFLFELMAHLPFIFAPSLQSVFFTYLPLWWQLKALWNCCDYWLELVHNFMPSMIQ